MLTSREESVNARRHWNGEKWMKSSLRVHWKLNGESHGCTWLSVAFESLLCSFNLLFRAVCSSLSSPPFIDVAEMANQACFSAHRTQTACMRLSDVRCFCERRGECVLRALGVVYFLWFALNTSFIFSSESFPVLLAVAWNMKREDNASDRSAALLAHTVRCQLPLPSIWLSGAFWVNVSHQNVPLWSCKIYIYRMIQLNTGKLKACTVTAVLCSLVFSQSYVPQPYLWPLDSTQSRSWTEVKCMNTTGF